MEENHSGAFVMSERIENDKKEAEKELILKEKGFNIDRPAE